ncbi:MAG: aminomethyl-transferring glycine dehydrogenase subunit GcvPB [Mycobacteriales bacterium]
MCAQETNHLEFASRHIGPNEDEVTAMLAAVGYPSLDALIDAAVPEGIRDQELSLPAGASEAAVTAELAALAALNETPVSMIGMGYHDTITPAVIRRNLLENPGWYTAYTPYQPEISQGRLEMLLNFQTLIEDLTGLPIAGASLLDEATAAAEAVALCRRVNSSTGLFLIDAACHPQTISVVCTRARGLGIAIAVRDLGGGLAGEQDVCGVLVQYPTTTGEIRDYRALAEEVHARGGLVVAAADPLALTLLSPPGNWGADVAVGSTGRFGIPMWFGGPHAGYLAVRAGLERSLPGRLVGVSLDADGKPAYRLALQTREQHIRRERATSNICTAQVLLAIAAASYAIYHGGDGLREIASRVHGHARRLAQGLREAGWPPLHDSFFDTVSVRIPGRADAVLAAAYARGINLRRLDADTLSVACDEVTEAAHIDEVLAAVAEAAPAPAPAEAAPATAPAEAAPAPAPAEAAPATAPAEAAPAPAPAEAAPATAPITAAALAASQVQMGLPTELRRKTPFLSHPVFHQYRSETSMMRYLRRLQDRDIALDRSMIPLGSCTMKLNAATEMEPISWPGFTRVHPYAPESQTAGYLKLISSLEQMLADITGYAAVSVQPNAGSQGEFAGLLAIRAYHRARGDDRRDVCLIPASAHGTNAASAAMAGLRVVVVACDEDGNVDLVDLRARLGDEPERIAAIMLTYPSTHGVFEPTVTEICAMVHEVGGQVYVDGANLNALVGLARPGRFGADVSHLNLHKTFCIPHGGGGPGVGPVAVREHLVPFLPGHPLAAGPVGAVCAAPYGSAGILAISWAYIRLMGAAGLRRASQVAVLSANYLACRLAEHYPVLYRGAAGLVAHECIVDLRPLTRATGVTVEDVAKRLIDYGFHAPTMSFPVAGTLMIEPTESENLAELDRFCAAMIAIRGEIQAVADGRWPREDNPLRGAPHTAECLLGDWDHPYGAEEAAYPLASLRADKYWPPVRRIEGAYGDRNLMCACPPMEAYQGASGQGERGSARSAFGTL